METRSRRNKRRVDDLDGEEKAVSLPVFTPITEPRIKKTSHAFLVQWRKDRREYEEKVRTRCKSTGEDQDEVLTLVKDSFDDGLLDILCKYRWNIKKEDLTEQVVLEKIEEILSTVKNSCIPDISALFEAELRMDMSETDVRERILQYFKLCEQIIMDHGLQECFSGESGMKEKCKLIIANIEPAAVRAEVETVVRFQKRDAQRNDVALHNVIVEIALENEKSFHRSKKARYTDKKPSSSATQARQPKTSFDKPKTNQKEQSASKWTRGGTKDAEAALSSNDRRAKPPADGCLKCGGDHWLSKCDVATDAEKLSLPLAHAKKKAEEREKKAKNAPKRIKRINQCIPGTVKHVTLNGKMDVPYCADSGSDLTYLSRYHATKLVELDPTIQIYDLETPIVSNAAGNHELVSTAAIKVQLTIGTAAGVVTIAEPRECLILESAEAELILGLDVLNILGINIDNQLERLAAREVGVDDDPIPFDDDDRVNESDKKELMAAIEDMIVRALDNGFPENLLEELRRIVFLYDIWRIALGRDPPARVPPLKIRLREGAVPHRSKPRNYAPHLKTFMKELNDELVNLGWVFENKEA